MKILSIETSTAEGSVAFLENDVVQFETKSIEQKSHSEVVHAFIEQGLAKLDWKISEIDLYATAVGPGSFTGIRVSINSAKSFSFVFKKPIVGIDSLTSLAQLNYPLVSALSQTKSISCMINAYKNMVYFSQFVVEGKQIKCTTAPMVVRVQDLDTVIVSPTAVFGDGFLNYEAHIKDDLKNLCLRPPGLVDYPAAGINGQLARSIWVSRPNDSAFEWNLVSPLYLRASEAEENKKGIKYTPL